MAIYYMNGNLLEARVNYICHQVNCQGKMGSGVARQIREKFPQVYESYMNSPMQLGDIQIVSTDNNKNVINMFAQEHYGYDGARYTSYDAFYSCLEKIKANVPFGSTIGFPYKIGCVRGGANWIVIKTMIEEVLQYHCTVVFYCYDGG